MGLSVYFIIFHNWKYLQEFSMGCNQTSEEHASIAPRMLEIPCTPESMGNYLNDMRTNPSKYAD